MSGISDHDCDSLCELDLSAKSLLLAMAALGSIYCITASKPPWQSKSMVAFLPGVADVWESLGVRVKYCMYDSPRVQEGAHKKLTCDEKQRAMLDCLASFHKDSNCNIVSVGDGNAEADALRRIGLDRMCESNDVRRPPLLAKIVHLLPSSSCDALCTQIRLLRLWIVGILEADENLEVDFAGDENELMADHLRFVGRSK